MSNHQSDCFFKPPPSRGRRGGGRREAAATEPPPASGRETSGRLNKPNNGPSQHDRLLARLYLAYVPRVSADVVKAVVQESFSEQEAEETLQVLAVAAFEAEASTLSSTSPPALSSTPPPPSAAAVAAVPLASAGLPDEPSAEEQVAFLQLMFADAISPDIVTALFHEHRDDIDAAVEALLSLITLTEEAILQAPSSPAINPLLDSTLSSMIGSSSTPPVPLYLSLAEDEFQAQITQMERDLEQMRIELSDLRKSRGTTPDRSAPYTHFSSTAFEPHEEREEGEEREEREGEEHPEWEDEYQPGFQQEIEGEEGEELERNAESYEFDDISSTDIEQATLVSLDEALSTLVDIFPEVDSSALRCVLQENDGDVTKATFSLLESLSKTQKHHHQLVTGALQAKRKKQRNARDVFFVGGLPSSASHRSPADPPSLHHLPSTTISSATKKPQQTAAAMQSRWISTVRSGLLSGGSGRGPAAGVKTVVAEPSAAEREKAAANLRNLWQQFPGIDEKVVEEVFRFNRHQISATVQSLRELYLSRKPVTRPHHSTTAAASRQSTTATPVSAGDALKLRTELTNLRQLRNMYFRQAAAAYMTGRGAEARELSAAGKRHEERLMHTTKVVAEHHLGGRSARNRLDLHGLQVHEALQMSKHYIEGCEKQLRDGTSTSTVIYIITGVGHHSPQGIARIKPALKQYLLDHGYKVREESGVLAIFLKSPV